MTLLQLIQEFTRRRGIPVPGAIFAANDDQALQLVGLLNQVLEDIITPGKSWSLLIKTATFSQLAQENQGDLDTIAPFGYEGMLLNTFYDRDQRLQVFGPKTPQEWELLKAVPMTGPYLQYRIQNNDLLLNGVFNAGHAMAFEYDSKWSVLAADGITYKEYYTADTDTNVFPAKLLMAGLSWQWKNEKGLRYSEDFRRYEVLKASLQSREGDSREVRMDGEGNGYAPGIFVPTASWQVVA